MRPFRHIVSCVALAIGACTTTDLISPLPSDTLRSAPTTVTVGGQALILAPSLWRNLQPGPSDQSELAAVLQVKASNGAALTAIFQITAVWVLYGDEQWATVAGEQRLTSPPPPLFYEGVARHGPKWPVGATTDVVVRLRDASGAEHLIRAVGPPIVGAQ